MRTKNRYPKNGDVYGWKVCGPVFTVLMALRVTKSLVSRGKVNAWKPGICFFRGMWYGDDPLKIESYGKIYDGVSHNHIFLGNYSKMTPEMQEAIKERLKK